MPAPIGQSDPDLDISLTFSMASLDPIGTPRRSGSLASSMNGLYATNSHTNLQGLGPSGGSRFFSNGLRTNGVATPPVENNGSAAGLYQRFEWLKDKESTKDKLTEEILARYAHLESKHEELARQLEQERSGRSPQPSDNHEEMYRSYLQRMTEILNREAFMLILIDGGGMIFNNILLRLGETGGQEAAKRLKDAVQNWAKTTLKDCPSHFKIVTRVYANVNGLAETCHRAGLVDSPDLIHDFVRGFTNSGDLFNFIDVGPGKHRADVKMNAEFKLHIWNYQCRHILFGGSHNNGFARLLEGYACDDEARSRVTLLEGVKFDKELAKLPFNKKKLDNLFRETKISLTPGLLTDLPRDRHDSKNAFNPASGVFTPASRTPAPDTPIYSPKTLPPPGISTPAQSVRGDLTRTNSIASSTAVSDSPAVAAPSGGTRGAGWANIARASAGLPLQDLTKKPMEAMLPAGPIIRRNKDGYRVDAHMEYNHDRVYELKKMKYCNQHYIGRGCCHWNSGNGNCPHKHDTKLNKDDLKWLRVVARETVCKKGTSCLEFDCIYGHHCPYPKMTEGSLRGIGCINGENCRFAKEMHGMDTTVASILRPEDFE